MLKRLKQWVQGEAGAADAAGQPGAEVQVLMVCMGNICRSPLAEGVLRAKLAEAGLQQRVAVDSAGTHGYHTHEPPDPRAIRLAAVRGYDIARQRARPVEPEDFARFHWMLAMDQANLEWLNKRAPPDGSPRIELLLSHARQAVQPQEVPDPYYGPDAGFEQVLNLVEDACAGFVLKLRAELANNLD